MSLVERARLEYALRRRAQPDTSTVVRWCPQTPFPRQQLFLELPHKEAFFGGAAGPGKSSALLMAALQYADIPGYSALLLRRTFADLNKAGALMDRAREWLTPTAARWVERDRSWVFPSGAKLAFGYLDTENDKYKYQGAEYQFVGFDELTQFSESQYTYLFSRLRRLAGSSVPIRMRAASNPGGIGALWVQERFIPEGFTPADAVEMRVFQIEGVDPDGDTVVRGFVPATSKDNLALDIDEYRKSLNELDAVTREQLLAGDWAIRERGNIYPMWDERYHVITWDEFEAVFGTRHIPTHWQLAAGHDCGFNPHPYAVSFSATAAENSPLPGRVFVYRELIGWDQTPREISRRIHDSMAPLQEFERVFYWRMSHEASSEQKEYREDFGLPFLKWEPDRNGGIAQIRDYLEIQHKDRPHPFRPSLEGQPYLYVVVPREGLVNPKGEEHLARHRAEFAAYKYKAPKSGDPPGKVVPNDIFDDAMCALKGVAQYSFPPIVPLSPGEVVERHLDKHYPLPKVDAETGQMVQEAGLVSPEEVAQTRAIEAKRMLAQVQQQFAPARRPRGGIQD